MLADEVEVDVIKTAENIKNHMEKLELTRSELGRITGLTRGCISNYTNAYNPPSLTNLGVLAIALNVSIGDIVAYKWNGGLADEPVNTEEN